MLSYKHEFHAGNHADVLKHIVLVHSLEYMKQKSKPMMYLDTHAGSAVYSRDSIEAQKNKEFETGISLIGELENVPDSVQNYKKLVDLCGEENTSSSYPGSPWLAKTILQSTDCMFLYELHSNEFTALERNMSRIKICHSYNSDGLQGLVASMPPVQGRGLVLIDPSYEIKTDYDSVVTAIKKAHRRFSNGTYLLWYPVVDRDRIDRLEKALVGSGIRDISLYELSIDDDSAAKGMTGSGMIVINQTWTLPKQMKEVLPFLANALGVGGKGRYRHEVLVAE